MAAPATATETYPMGGIPRRKAPMLSQLVEDPALAIKALIEGCYWTETRPAHSPQLRSRPATKGVGSPRTRGGIESDRRTSETTEAEEIQGTRQRIWQRIFDHCHKPVSDRHT